VEPRRDDRFIFLGDYCDGWSDAAETVSFLIEFATQHNCIFIRGNHDYLVHRYLKHDDNNPLWLAHGGEASKKSYEALPAIEKEKHISFFEGLINYDLDNQNRLFVHAGFTNVNGIQHEHFKNLVFWDRTLWETARCLDSNILEESNRYPQRLKLYREIYIGHTPVTRMNSTLPLHFANVWNIDTGAAFLGPLTAIDIDTKKQWQSDPVHTFYPTEKGRN
jgi:serine/threonine protein phosphatase 1